MTDARQLAVLHYVAGLQTTIPPDEPDHLSKLMHHLNTLPDADNGTVLALFEANHKGSKFTPSALLSAALRAYDGSDPRDFLSRLRFSTMGAKAPTTDATRPKAPADTSRGQAAKLLADQGKTSRTRAHEAAVDLSKPSRKRTR